MEKNLIKQDVKTFTGADVIKNFQISAPTTPGIYKMINQNGVVIYVGKAKNLKNRLKNYTDLSGLSKRIANMVMSVAKVEIIKTETEYLALLMESSLIKSLHPRYNILLKDDKSYPYITISKDEIPRLQKFRLAGIELKNRSKQSKYFFGPYASIGDINEAIKLIQKAFGIRVCSDSELKNRIRPCILYQIKRCMAPCMINRSNSEYTCNKMEYLHSVQDGINFLSGRSGQLINNLKNKMQSYSEKQEYEQASIIRDKIELISSLQQEKNIHNLTDEKVDIIGIGKNDNYYAIKLLLLRYGSVVGNYTFFPEHTEYSDIHDILIAFIKQFYTNHDKSELPKEIWIQQTDKITINTISEYKDLENIFNFKIIEQKRGHKKSSVDFAIKQASQVLETYRIEKFKNNDFLEKIKTEFQILNNINRIDVFDNSHLFGTNKVGAMIVFTRENGFDKKLYRKYNITQDIAGDDYKMMREVLERRYTRAIKENTKPDLIIVDGGRGQLFIASEVIRKLNIDIPIVAIAKAENRRESNETFFIPNHPAIKIKDKSLLFFIERLRDEVHRFVITTHRKKRAKNTLNSELDNIEGIGAKKKKALLLYFGSIKNIINKTSAEIMKVDGINEKLADKIYKYFH